MKKENVIAQILFIIGFAVMVLGFILGLISGSVAIDFGVSTFVGSVVLTWTASGFISGMLFIGLAEIIELLHKINGKLPDNDEQNAQVNDTDNDELDFTDKRGHTITEIDIERIHKVYKDHQIEEIIPTPYEDYCIVKLIDKETYDIVEIGGFVPIILSNKEQPDMQNRVRNWYENEYSQK